MVKTERISARIDEETLKTLKLNGINPAQAIEIATADLNGGVDKTIEYLDKQGDLLLKEIKHYDEMITIYDNLINQLETQVKNLKKYLEDEEKLWNLT